MLSCKARLQPIIIVRNNCKSRDQKNSPHNRYHFLIFNIYSIVYTEISRDKTTISNQHIGDVGPTLNQSEWCKWTKYNAMIYRAIYSYRGLCEMALPLKRL